VLSSAGELDLLALLLLYPYWSCGCKPAVVHLPPPLLPAALTTLPVLLTAAWLPGTLGA
jgi:hypothetical protein